MVNSIGSNHNIYQKILEELKSEYTKIGQREVSKVLGNSDATISGGFNNIGFSYKKPFVDFSISADRNLAPDLFDDKKWIVTDKFSIYIDASKLLSNLKDRSVIDLSEKNLAAFAGIVFKRTFTWVHFANSYKEGLTTHFEKLFLPFSAFDMEKISNLESNEIIYKEDSLSAKAGGVVSAPLYSGLSGSVGVMAKFENLSKIEIVSTPDSLGNQGSGDHILLSFEKSKIKSIGTSLLIQADFLKILKYTLLSYDFNYDFEKSSKIYLNFNQVSLKEMQSDDPLYLEIDKILSSEEANQMILSPYLISEENKASIAVGHKYNFLLFGGMKNSKTLHVEVITKGRVKNFFRHYFEKIKYTESLFSRIFSNLVYAITNTDSSISKLASDSKKVTIEYESEKNLLELHEDLDIKNNEQKLSLNFSAEFNTKKSSGFGGKKYRERSAFLLKRYSGVDPRVVEMVENESLVSPFTISGQYQVNLDGIQYLNTKSIDQVFDSLDDLCHEYPKTSFFNFRNLFDNCRRSLQNDYIVYFKDLSHEKITADVIDLCESKSNKFIFSSSKKRAYLKNCLSDLTIKNKDERSQIPLWPLKNFTNNIVNNANSKIDYYNLFGAQNVFFHGAFDALTDTGESFTANFHEGEFKGLGAIDHYMRMENLRAPSSVVIDQ
jgi:hypothetical protein